MISEVIAKLQKIMDEHGDLQCFDANFVLVDSHAVRVFDEGDHNCPDDWNMPPLFVMLGDENP